MGNIIKLQCPKCSWEKELFLGGGLKDCEMKTVRKILPTKKHWQLKAALAAMQPPRFSIERCAGRCQNCQTIATVPIVKFLKQDGTMRDITGLCEKCGGEVEIFSLAAITEGRLHCQFCGEPVIWQENGHWD